MGGSSFFVGIFEHSRPTIWLVAPFWVSVRADIIPGFEIGDLISRAPSRHLGGAGGSLGYETDIYF